MAFFCADASPWGNRLDAPRWAPTRYSWSWKWSINCGRKAQADWGCWWEYILQIWGNELGLKAVTTVCLHYCSVTPWVHIVQDIATWLGPLLPVLTTGYLPSIKNVKRTTEEEDRIAYYSGLSTSSKVLEYHPEPWDQWKEIGNLQSAKSQSGVLSIGAHVLPCLSGESQNGHQILKKIFAPHSCMFEWHGIHLEIIKSWIFHFPPALVSYPSG